MTPAFRNCVVRRPAPRSCGASTRRIVPWCQASACCPRSVCRTHSTVPTSTVRGRDLRLRLEADTAVGDGESILEGPSARAAVRLRRPWHIVRRHAVADRAVRAGDAVQARRLRHRRAARVALLHRDRWLPAADRPASRLHGRTDLRGGVARKRRCLRQVVARPAGARTAASAS